MNYNLLMIKILLFIALFYHSQYQLYNLRGENKLDNFGSAMILSNNVLVISAIGYPSGNQTGKVYAYDANTHALLYTLQGINANDFFGSSLNVTGSYLIVTALGYPSGTKQGAVLVFNITTGVPLFNMSGTTAGDNCGYSLATSGELLMIGCFGSASKGLAQVYNLTSRTLKWNFPGPYIKSASSGFIVTMYNMIGYVGDPGYNSNSGAVLSYDLVNGTLNIGLTFAAYNNFGSSIVPYQNYVLSAVTKGTSMVVTMVDMVGATYSVYYNLNCAVSYSKYYVGLRNDSIFLYGDCGLTPSTCSSNIGSITAVDFTATTFPTPFPILYTLQGNTTNEHFGYLVYYFNEFIVVTSSNYPTPLAAGFVRVFDVRTGMLKMVMMDPIASNHFGTSAAMNSNMLLVGSPGFNNSQGMVTSYQLVPCNYGELLNGTTCTVCMGVSISQLICLPCPSGSIFVSGKGCKCNDPAQLIAIDPVTNTAACVTSPTPSSPSGESSVAASIIGPIAGSVGGLLFILLIIFCCMCIFCILFIFIIMIIFIFFIIFLFFIIIIVVILLVLFIFVIQLIISKRGGTKKHFDFENMESIPSDPSMFEYGNYRELKLKEIEMVSLIGEGATGKVYKAKWRSMAVAVKMVPKSIADEEQLSEFRKELEICSKLGNHPNIIPFIGAVTKDPDTYYLVTRFCEKLSVHDHVIKNGLDLSEFELSSILTESAAGLEYLHSENVVHRDIAARNFLIADPWKIYLTDFGHSRLLGNDNGTQSTKNK